MTRSSRRPPPPSARVPRPHEVLGILIAPVSFVALLEALTVATADTRASLVAPLAGGVLATMVSALRVARARPVYRAIGFTPPSPAAVRDVVSSGWLTAGAFLAPHGLTTLLVARDQLALALLAAGFGLLGAWSVLLSFRVAFEPWLRAFAADDLTSAAPTSAARALAWEFCLASGGGATVFAGLVAAGPPSKAVAIASIAGPSVAALGGYKIGSQLGRRIDEEMRLLAGRITGFSGAAAAALDLDGLSLADVRAVGRRVEAAAAAFTASAAEEERARKGARELQRQKLIFMASMSHDLRSPLNALLGFSELLHTGAADFRSAQRQSVHAIVRSGHELLELLNDVLDSARFDAGRLPLKPGWVPAVEILTEVVHLGEEIARARDLSVDAELEPGLPPLYVDRERTVQAVVCLFRHGARAMERGTLQLKAWVDRTDGGTPVRVAVIDRSEGIRREDRDRIFEAFRQLSRPSGRRIGGLGLGLALARSLIVAQGGDISAESEAHRGTTFTVSLPTSGPAP